MMAYDAMRFEPPAPVVTVALRRLDGGLTVPDIHLLLDTGADLTLLPRSSVALLGDDVLSDRQYVVAGFDGAERLSSVALLEVTWLNRRFRGQFVVSDVEMGILGRDILNRVRIVLDGPNETWSEQRS